MKVGSSHQRPWLNQGQSLGENCKGQDRFGAHSPWNGRKVKGFCRGKWKWQMEMDSFLLIVPCPALYQLSCFYSLQPKDFRVTDPLTRLSRLSIIATHQILRLDSFSSTTFYLSFVHLISPPFLRSYLYHHWFSLLLAVCTPFMSFVNLQKSILVTREHPQILDAYYQPLRVAGVLSLCCNRSWTACRRRPCCYSQVLTQFTLSLTPLR